MAETAKEWDWTRNAWNRIIDACDLSVAGISRQYEIAYSSLKNWLEDKATPRAKSRKAMEEVLMKLEKRPRIPFHPSYGYATAEQIARLKESIPEYDRKKILEQVEKQTRLQGKID